MYWLFFFPSKWGIVMTQKYFSVSPVLLLYMKHDVSCCCKTVKLDTSYIIRVMVTGEGLVRLVLHCWMSIHLQIVLHCMCAAQIVEFNTFPFLSRLDFIQFHTITSYSPLLSLSKCQRSLCCKTLLSFFLMISSVFCSHSILPACHNCNSAAGGFTVSPLCFLNNSSRLFLLND